MSTIVTKSQSYYLQIDGSGHVNTYIYGIGQSDYLVSNGTIPLDLWTHVVMTYDGSVERIYINGSLDSSWSGTGSIVNSSDHLGIGMNLNTNGNPYASYNRPFAGSIDEVGLWSRALTGSEVSDLWNGSHGDTIVEITGLSLGSPNQYKSDATTPIAEDSTTTESTVVFGAIVESTSTSEEQLQVEVEPAGTGFADTPNVTSSVPVNPGNYATSTYNLSPELSSNGSYHWQARVFDGTHYSSWQTFGSSTGSTDFVINTVPLYTQDVSDYPSESETESWASSTYAEGTPSSSCAGETSIAACGCTITSVVMDLRYLGFTTDASGTDINPGDFNTWLNGNGGYDPDGYLNWYVLPSYVNNNIIQFTTSSADSYLNDFVPAILGDNNVPLGGGGTTPHFVVATGFASNEGTSTYTIRDPAWYHTQYLNEASNGDGLVKDFDNNIDSIHILQPIQEENNEMMSANLNSFSGLSSIPSHHQLPLELDYTVDAPNGILVTDPSGYQTGINSATGVVYEGIPNSTYDDSGSRVVRIVSPEAGHYTIQVIGGTTGSYYLETGVSDGINIPKSQVATGTIETGNVMAYTQSYDPNNLQSAIVTFQSATSSTVGIIASSSRVSKQSPFKISILTITPIKKVPALSPLIFPASTTISTANTSTLINNTHIATSISSSFLPEATSSRFNVSTSTELTSSTLK
jgi:hypothetical protein